MSEHEPMLDGITRWTYERHPSFPAGMFYLDGDGHAPEGADYVLFSDLPALLAKVREDERAAALRDALYAVSAQRRHYEFSWGLDESSDGEWIRREYAIAAIDALGGER